MLLLLLGYVAALFGTVAIIKGVQRASRGLLRVRARRRLVGTPLLLGDGREGTYVKLTGVVRVLGNPLVAPLSRQPCVAYRSRAYELRQSYRSPFPVGQPIDYQTVRIQAFALVRPNERDVHVEGTFAELDLAPVRLAIDRARMQAFFRAHRVIATGGCGHLDETVVRDGDRVTIAGTLVAELDIASTTDERGFRDDGPRRLVLLGDAEHPLVIGAVAANA